MWVRTVRMPIYTVYARIVEEWTSPLQWNFIGVLYKNNVQTTRAKQQQILPGLWTIAKQESTKILGLIDNATEQGVTATNNTTRQSADQCLCCRVRITRYPWALQINHLLCDSTSRANVSNLETARLTRARACTVACSCSWRQHFRHSAASVAQQMGSHVNK